MKAGAKASSGPRNSTGNSSAYPKGGPVAKLRRPPQVVNAKAKVDTRRPRSSSPARPRPEQQQAPGPPAEEVFDERKTRAVSPKYRSRSGVSSGSTRLAKESEELPQEKRSSSPQRTTPRVTMEALQAENSWLKQQVERQRAEIQELRSQVPVPNEPMASWLGVTIPQVSSRSTTPGKVQSTYVSTATRNVVVAAACPCPNSAPLTTPASLTPRMVRVAPAQAAEPVSTPRLVENAYPVYMPVAYPSYAAGQVLPQVQPQVLRFHSVGHTQTLG